MDEVEAEAVEPTDGLVGIVQQPAGMRDARRRGFDAEARRSVGPRDG
jgi:hypothetical protein